MMTPLMQITGTVVLCIGAILPMVSTGCSHHRECCPKRPAPPAPLGSLIDPVFRKQERNAEASDFVLHQHEFEGNTARLNDLGETHLKQIAVRACRVPFPILVEPSSIAVKEGTEYGYPIHPDPDLDRNRRKVIVQALLTMGVPDAERRVVIAHALTPGFEQFEAERAYNQGFSGSYNAFRGGGGFGGGFGSGFGFGGGFGGGFF